ncbi:IS110 family transposase [Novosphingobium pentaromativorans]|uniref:Putative transposase n=1 Tax=Novosphingobium pentaromativorans US6-1 TaxID=1088721 RepID=G6EFR2_9SPHN|nr:IS110 family transposase [Novosphingobium pentaromativorans]EHJ59840.1 putative transposase [Novosphingobium pentaromativorans US6-1]
MDRQRTQLVNAIRGHLVEYGWVAPRGKAHMAMLADLLEEEGMTATLPQAAQPMFKLMIEHLAELEKRIAELDREITRRTKEDEDARRLMTIPGIGPIVATAILALAPSIETFRKSRDFAAWLGRTPRQHSIGGKQRLGSISRMGERTIRRLLIIGGSSMVRQATRFGAPEGSWLERMLARKPRMLVSVALANKMARMVWALLTRHHSRASGFVLVPAPGIPVRRLGRECLAASDELIWNGEQRLSGRLPPARTGRKRRAAFQHFNREPAFPDPP